MKLITTLALMVVFGALLLSMESAQGIKCFHCTLPCADESKQKEEDCEVNHPGSTSCITIEKQNGQGVSKGCRTPNVEEEAKLKGIKCDDFGAIGQKWCFCRTDLCNEKASDIGLTVPTPATTSSTANKSNTTTGAPMITGYSSRHLLIGAIIVSVAAYFAVIDNHF